MSNFARRLIISSLSFLWVYGGFSCDDGRGVNGEDDEDESGDDGDGDGDGDGESTLESDAPGAVTEDFL